MADDHDQQLARLQSEVAALQQAITSLAALPDTQRSLQKQLAEQERLFLTSLPGLSSRHCHAHCAIGCAPAIWAPSVAQAAG